MHKKLMETYYNWTDIYMNFKKSMYMYLKQILKKTGILPKRTKKGFGFLFLSEIRLCNVRHTWHFKHEMFYEYIVLEKHL